MPTEPSTTPDYDALDVKQLLAVLTAFKKGDFSPRMPAHHTGLAGKVADTLNEIIEREELLDQEYTRVSVSVGKEGRISQRLAVEAAPAPGDGRSARSTGSSMTSSDRLQT